MPFITWTVWLTLSLVSDINMNTSNNPFLPQFEDPNESFVLNEVPPQAGSRPHIFMDSTPVSVSKPADQLTVLVQPPPVMPDRRTISQFSGFMHEDSENFLSEFESYLTLAAIEITSPRAVAAFHLFLKGPALIWFNSLSVRDL